MPTKLVSTKTFFHQNISEKVIFCTILQSAPTREGYYRLFPLSTTEKEKEVLCGFVKPGFLKL